MANADDIDKEITFKQQLGQLKNKGNTSTIDVNKDDDSGKTNTPLVCVGKPRDSGFESSGPLDIDADMATDFRRQRKRPAYLSDYVSF